MMRNSMRMGTWMLQRGAGSRSGRLRRDAALVRVGALASVLAVALASVLLCAGCRVDASAADAGPGGDAGDMNPGGDAGDVGDAGSVGGGTWTALPDLPEAMQETVVVALDGRIYVIGGFDDARQVRADVWVYDVAGRTWDLAAPLPMPMHHANAAVVDGTLYVLGGLVGLGFDEVGDTWAYDPGADRWTARAPMSPESARGSAAVGVIDGKIYLAGGYRNDGAVTNVSVYDPVDDAWDHDLAPLPAPRDHLVGAAVGGVLYAIGGRDRFIAAITDRVDAYDPVADAWTSRAPMITGRGGMAAGVVDGSIVVVGGEGDPMSPVGVFPQTERYDPVADTWTALAPMVTPRHGMGAAGFEGALYVPGGATREGFGAVAVFESFTP